MKPVLIACEFTQTVTAAFRAMGIEAYSCDIIPTLGNPAWHIQDDAIKVLYSQEWGLVIAHPPCTYMSAAGALYINQPGRAELRAEAADFFMKFYNYNCAPIAIENPRPLHCAGLPPYDQVIDPTQFGAPWRKRTCLWLRGLPLLFPTHCYNSTAKSLVYHTRGGRNRSKFFPEVAAAMAAQWFPYILP